MGDPTQDPKEKILMAARSLFAEKGFDGTTVRQICEKAGVNQALVSYYFGGKESLYIAILDHFVTVPEDFGETASSEDPVTLLKIIVQQLVRWRLSNPEIVQIAQREMLSKSHRLAGVMTRVAPFWEFVRDVLDRGKQQGRFRFQSLDQALLLVMGSLMYPNSYPLHEILKTEEAVSERLVYTQTLQFILGGLGCRE